MLRIGERTWGWLGPLAVALLAFALRARDLASPSRLLFDETYYAKHAWSLLQHGYVRDFESGADARIAAGRTEGLFADGPTQIAHPEGGKWLIALGEQVFGLDSFGWRISAVVVGALTVLVLARLVRRLTGSTWLGCLAGLLLCLDGMHFVMSRLALLDGFLAFWIVCAVACLAADRDHMVRRVEVSTQLLPWRPWQVAAGICLGMAVATKWSGLVLLAVLGLLVVGWEMFARRRAALIAVGPRPRPRWWLRTTLAVGIPAFASLVLVALAVYLVTWTGWLVNHEVYAQRYDLTGNRFAQLWQFHQLTWSFHTGDYLAGQTHPYESKAWSWPFLDRPVAVDAQNDLPSPLCHAAADSSCIEVITLLGNPAVWWAGTAAVIASVVIWLYTRAWQLGLALACFLAAWLPWVVFDDRPIFSFYAVVMLPFMIVLICVLGRMVWEAAGPRARRVLQGGVAAYVLTVVLVFWFFLPVLTGEVVPRDEWADRMWFDRWI